ncbi:DUF3899 domain-containing protein [Virgibacillus doumboii]|uniref:DUF3899 domain-containing protein n=1 Tax=Virgibacillus doumboii TaxID=2697503 RepID=UPI0013E016BD|nr:DUF3899 domain-containing protein [Virgibacillus doumboii]
MRQKNWVILTANIGLILILVNLSESGFSLVQCLNITFYFLLIYMVIYLAMYTIKGGFFDGVTFGFRRFRHVMSKDPDYLDDWKKKPLPSYKVNSSFYRFVRFQSFALLLLLIVLILVYYSK